MRLRGLIGRREERVVLVGPPAHEGEAPAGFSAARMLAKASAGWSKNITPKREKTRSADAGLERLRPRHRPEQRRILAAPAAMRSRATSSMGSRDVDAEHVPGRADPAGPAPARLPPQPQPMSSTRSPARGSAASIAAAVTSPNGRRAGPAAAPSGGRPRRSNSRSGRRSGEVSVMAGGSGVDILGSMLVGSGDRQSIGLEPFDMEPNGFADLLLDLSDRCTRGDASWKVRNIGRVVLALHPR